MQTAGVKYLGSASLMEIIEVISPVISPNSGFAKITFLEPRYRIYSSAINESFREINSRTTELENS
jgi:hypothetical protein